MGFTTDKIGTAPTLKLSTLWKHTNLMKVMVNRMKTIAKGNSLKRNLPKSKRLRTHLLRARMLKRNLPKSKRLKIRQLTMNMGSSNLLTMNMVRSSLLKTKKLATDCAAFRMQKS